MYIQITTRCNMTCEHCCYSCTDKGEDMSFNVFKKALEFDGETVALGGGEPTIHPQFNDFLLYAITNVENVWLATNGKLADKALMLSKLARRGVIACELSLDIYHDPIDDKVVKAFEIEKKNREYISSNQSDDLRGVRNVSGKELKSGRCNFGNEGCPCEESIVKPNGDIKQCGCENSPTIGNVLSIDNETFWDTERQCYKENDSN